MPMWKGEFVVKLVLFAFVVIVFKWAGNASLALSLLNAACYKLILLSPELYLIFICVGASNKCPAGPAGGDLIPTEITF